MSSKLKIAYLSVFHPFRGGIAQFNNELFKSLEKVSDVKAFNFTTQYPKVLFPGKTQFVDIQKEMKEFDSLPVLSSINPISYLSTIKAIRKFDPDVVLTTFWMPFFGPSLGTVCKQLKSKAKCISILHNVIPHEKRIGDKQLTQYYLKQQDGFCVMSETVEKDLKTWHSAPRYFLRSHPLYGQFGPLVDKKIAKQKFGIQSDQKVLLFFGFIRKYKGLDLLIEAFSKLQEDTVLLITGECYGDFSVFEDQIKNLGIDPDRIKSVIKYIPDSEVATIFSASDLCILPYRSATQSGIASISKFYKLPMVVTPVGELPNEVKNLETGLVAASSDPEDLAKSIHKALDLLPTFKKELQSELEENTWSNFSAKLVDFIQSV